MNYIYDILLNFKEIYYDFYDWNISDEIQHIRKIPLFKISKKDLNNIINNNIKIEDNILSKINNKTEIFNNNKVQNSKYATLFSDGDDVVAIIFDKNGCSKKISSLLIDESCEVLEVALDIPLIKINYDIVSENKKNVYITRKEYERFKYINKQINKIDIKSDISKLQYLYYECFGKFETDANTIIENLKKELNNKWHTLNESVYNFFKITSLNK